jgi:uncharacterized membrane protein YcaP (DUF421 family)
MPHYDSWAALWAALWANLTQLGMFADPMPPVSVLEKIVRPVLVYLLLVFALKKAGKRMLAQLNPFDFVVLLTLSNTVQNAIIGNDTSLLGGVIGAAALLGANAVLVRFYYRGPEMTQIASGERDIRLIADGQLQEDAMRRLHINAGELIAKAHERGFDSLDEVESAVLYPNGTIYFRGQDAASEAARHRELLGRLDALGAQLAALRR